MADPWALAVLCSDNVLLVSGDCPQNLRLRRVEAQLCGRKEEGTCGMIEGLHHRCVRYHPVSSLVTDSSVSVQQIECAKNKPLSLYS